jgi:hypothetical protein
MPRAALPTFNERSAELTYVFWGGTTATGTLLGQVENFNWTSGLESRDTYRIGASTRYSVYTSQNIDWDMTIFEDDDISEIGLILGSSKPTAGGWTAGTSITHSTNPTGVTVTVASYNSEVAATATLLWEEVLTVAKVENVNPQRTANEINKWAFSGRAETVKLTPASGMGA